MNKLSRTVPILFKGHSRSRDTLAYAATASNLSVGLSALRGHHSGLSEDDLSTSHDLEGVGNRFDGSNHVIDDDTFLLRGIVVEASRPTFKGLETEWE